MATAGTKRPFRPWRIVGWAAALLLGLPLLLVVLLLGVILIGANTGAGRHLIERQAASLTGGLVGIVAGFFGGIVDAARRDGSVHFPVESVPGEFVAWRRRVRQRARGDGLSISVIRAGGFVVVENREWERSEAEGSAVADVIQGVLTGDRVTYDDALHRRRRERLRLT